MKKYDNFKAALVNLKDIYSYQEPYGNVELAGMINDEEMWLDALVSRNNVAHAYNKSIAMDIINQTKSRYYDMFVRLQNTIEQHWI